MARSGSGEKADTVCAHAYMQSLQAGGSLKQLVALVGGSTSGFTNIIAAYVTTFTVTIAVSVICLGLAMAMYAVRTDQKLRRDLRYGGARLVALPNPGSAARPPAARISWCMTRVCKASTRVMVACDLPGPCSGHAAHMHVPITVQRPAKVSCHDKLRHKLMRLLHSPALTLLLRGLTLAAVCAESERSLGVYKVYYWLTATLFVLMFIMAAWFVVLVAVNTTGGNPLAVTAPPVTASLDSQCSASAPCGVPDKGLATADSMQ